MKFRRLLQPPGRSVWWLTGTLLAGLLLPTVVATGIMLAGYSPIGSALPDWLPWGSFGAVLANGGVSAIALLAAPLYSLLAWSWRPLVLAFVFAAGALIGFVPGTLAGAQAQNWAFGLLSGRSVELVDAIEHYVHEKGRPPTDLGELVPNYLSMVPTTGMAAEPEYRYEPKSGPCSVDNAWHLWVSVPKFIDMNRLLYCPKQDYEPAGGDVRSRMVVGAWVYDQIDF